MTDMAAELCRFISTEVLLEEDPSAVEADTKLVDGVLDSLGILQVVSYIRDEFGVTFEEADVTPENFRTVASIERLVRRKLEGE